MNHINNGHGLTIMSTATIIMAPSGHGKSASLRNLDPEKTILIQTIRKPLPFMAKDWKNWDGATKTGSIAVTDSAKNICAAIDRASANGKEIVVIDDFIYCLTNEFMRRSKEKSFEKFNDIGRAAWDVMTAAMNAPDNVRVYILSHIQTDEYGQYAKIKTVGKMIDEKIVLEGMVTTVLRAVKQDKKYLFQTQSDGTDTVKSPMGLFDSEFIDNDLKLVDDRICEYYGINQKEKESETLRD